MWRLWMLFDPRRTLVGIAGFLAFLALLIHFMLLSTSTYNWMEHANKAAPVASQMVPVPGAQK